MGDLRGRALHGLVLAVDQHQRLAQGVEGLGHQRDLADLRHRHVATEGSRAVACVAVDGQAPLARALLANDDD